MNPKKIIKQSYIFRISLLSGTNIVLGRIQTNILKQVDTTFKKIITGIPNLMS